MKNSALILLVSAALGAPNVLSGQETQIPQTLSLRDAVEIAARNNPAYRQTANDLAPATWGVRNAYAAFLPTFGISGGMSYAGAGTQNFFGTTSFEQLSSTVGSRYNMGFNLTLNGRTFTQPALARAQLKATEASIRAAAAIESSSWPDMSPAISLASSYRPISSASSACRRRRSVRS